MFNYQKICQELLKELLPRQKEIICRRFGLAPHQGFGGGKKETLEAIGRDFDITRERVRQIEEDGLSQIKPKLAKYQKVFQYFNQELKKYGGLRKEEILLADLGGKKQQAQVYFLLTISENFERFGENEDFHSFWAINQNSLILAKKIINSLYNKLEEIRKPLSLKELSSFSDFKNPALVYPSPFRIPRRSATGMNPAPFISNKKCGMNGRQSILSPGSKTPLKGGGIYYLEISKKILPNAEGFYGLKDWLEINPRGVKDKAYLVFKKLEKPLHFKEVAEFIEGALNQTVHNELIKDPRFVLVGRGIYALKEWGYISGQVKDVIAVILKEQGPLTQSEILEKVLKQRLVKESTILLNLSNKKHFLRDAQGKYQINEI